ncbi:hypothetical protein B0T16DRAFT_404076 [Cercophora newfieldiana]|uniref:Uncharacterized protein n=1 Tax=Cercophora newfieldiana TaxID=92897 RepID=A0AA39YI88_9PEZI|nr:hypothetical protein B0T16DRAFT_404076 [Cercophora newfieldiana]
MTTPISTSTTNDPSSPSPFRKFDDYPWLRDRHFLQGLTTTLGPLSNSFERQKALGVTLQARIWWYQSRHATTIDRSAYETWTSTSSNPSTVDQDLLDKVEDIQRRMGIVAPAPSVGGSGNGNGAGGLPEWMVSAPRRVDLGVKADDGVGRGEAVQGAGGEGAPYPAHFQAIIEAVTTGKPVAGVKEIPNTVVRQAGISPVGKMQAPRKPWERQQQQQQEDQGRLLDEEFPPVEEREGAEPLRG